MIATKIRVPDRAPTKQFVDSIAINLAYWREKIGALEERQLSQLDNEWRNIYRAIEFGLSLDECWREAAELVLQVYLLVTQRGYSREWIPLTEACIRLCGQEDLPLKGQLLNRLGDFYRLDHRFDAAEAAHKEEREIGLALDDKERLAYAYFGLGKVAWGRRKHNKAERYAKKALIGFQQSGNDPQKVGSAMSLLGLTAQYRGNFSLAEERFNTALSYHRRSGDKVNVARTLNGLAIAQAELGKVEEAESNYLKGLALYDEAHAELEKPNIEASLGTLYFKQGDYGKAKAAYLRANSPALRRSGQRYLQALANNNLGNVYLAMGELKRAEAYLLLAIDLWRRVDAKLMLANTLGTQAQTFVAGGKLAEALPLYEEAIDLASLFKSDHWACDLLRRFWQERQELMAQMKSDGQPEDGPAGLK